MPLHRPLAVATLLAVGAALTGSGAEAASLSLLGGRFDVEAAWRTPDGRTGVGTPVALTDETGYFWFFSPTNVEVVVKGLDACASGAPRFWIFAGGLTDAQVELLVTDQATGQKKIYRNPQGRAFQPIQDTDAFATCATPRCGRGGLAEMAATPRADLEAETLALVLGGGLTAPQPLYERLTADLAVIRQRRPDLAGIPYTPKVDPRTLFVTFDSLVTASAAAGGTYHAWDCLNRWYGAAVEEGPYAGTILRLHFDKVLDTRQLVADYAALPGVTAVELNYFGRILPFPDVVGSLCGLAVGSRHHYFVRQPSNPSQIYYFDSEPGTAPRFVGSTAGDPPAWLPLAYQCFGVISLD